MSHDQATADAYRNNRVGPVLRACGITSSVVEAAEEDNPDKTIRVDDKLAYVRIDCESPEAPRPGATWPSAAASPASTRSSVPTCTTTTGTPIRPTSWTRACS
jgi:hypothetical protein